jgi:Ca-activated chloride channel family protein
MQKRLALAVLLMPAAAVIGHSAQQPQQPVFRSTVETVPIYATVVDAKRRLVPDLAQEHFEIYDNRVPQPITLFRSDVQPISVVIALDTSGSMTMVLDVVKQAAESFILRLLPADRARIGTFDDKLRWSDTFTSNRDDLLRYLHTEMQFGNGTRLWDGLDEAIAAVEREKNRRVVLVLSDGDDMYSKIVGSDDVLRRAQENDVMIYGIGLRNAYRGGPMGQMILSRPDGALKGLIENTGGGYFELPRTAELNATFTRVAEELHRQYVLGFTPKVLDGKVHELDVRVKVNGMTVRARKSYLAAKTGT